MGRVTKQIIGRDKVVRGLQMKTRNGHLIERPLQLVISFEISNSPVDAINKDDVTNAFKDAATNNEQTPHTNESKDMNNKLASAVTQVPVCTTQTRNSRTAKSTARDVILAQQLQNMDEMI